MSKIGIIGAGAWGTSLATVMRRAGNEVVLQAHEPETAAAINKSRTNPAFLPGVELDSEIKVVTSLSDAVDADAVLLVAPAQHIRAARAGQ